MLKTLHSSLRSVVDCQVHSEKVCLPTNHPNRKIGQQLCINPVEVELLSCIVILKAKNIKKVHVGNPPYACTFKFFSQVRGFGTFWTKLHSLHYTFNEVCTWLLNTYQLYCEQAVYFVQQILAMNCKVCLTTAVEPRRFRHDIREILLPCQRASY